MWSGFKLSLISTQCLSVALSCQYITAVQLCLQIFVTRSKVANDERSWSLTSVKGEGLDLRVSSVCPEAVLGRCPENLKSLHTCDFFMLFTMMISTTRCWFITTRWNTSVLHQCLNMIVQHCIIFTCVGTKLSMNVKCYFQFGRTCEVKTIQ